FALMALRLGMSSQHTAATAAHLEEVAFVPAAVAAVWEPLFVGPPIPPPDDPTRTIAAELRPGDSLDRSLKQYHVPSSQLERLYEALDAVFDLRQVKPGDYYEVAIDTSDAIRRFCYTPHRTPDRPIEVKMHDDQFVARQLQLPLVRRVERLEVPIEDNLSNAISKAGEGSTLSDVLADDIFGAVIDFQRDPRRGDRLGVVFEKLYIDEHFVRYGDVLLARYEGERVTELAVRYAATEGADAYYNASGRSLGRMFVLKPLGVNRITSGFSRQRFHPILKKQRPHLGTDYGAPTGTLVWTTARGQVAFAGWQSGYGKLVEIDHANGYRTRYAHLSKILVRKGQRVEQKEIIGKVGATGLATASHLHYEIIKDGHHINPELINEGHAVPTLADDLLPEFVRQRDALLHVLALGPRIWRYASTLTAAPL
ncbi:MAG: peptidoglycan DD-metalloendopeptidase family protein, partial [Gemmatimonadetes bacterium]|nr:peptidoglycan DD-metalloendopeptidase family protein [Gemmatimonadota bacterium]